MWGPPSDTGAVAYEVHAQELCNGVTLPTPNSHNVSLPKGKGSQKTGLSLSPPCMHVLCIY